MLCFLPFLVHEDPFFFRDRLEFFTVFPFLHETVKACCILQGWVHFFSRSCWTVFALVSAMNPSSHIAPAFASSSAFSLPSVTNFSKCDICFLSFFVRLFWERGGFGGCGVWGVRDFRLWALGFVCGVGGGERREGGEGREGEGVAGGGGEKRRGREEGCREEEWWWWFRRLLAHARLSGHEHACSSSGTTTSLGPARTNLFHRLGVGSSNLASPVRSAWTQDRPEWETSCKRSNGVPQCKCAAKPLRRSSLRVTEESEKSLDHRGLRNFPST